MIFAAARGTPFSSATTPVHSAESAHEILAAVIPHKRAQSTARRAVERMCHRGTVGACYAFSKMEQLRNGNRGELTRFVCAGVSAHFLTLDCERILAPRKSRPADRWRETILLKLLRPDLESAKARRDLARHAHQISATEKFVFRLAWSYALNITLVARCA